MSKVPEKQKGDPETTGHSWDGIEEFNNPLPRWWLWTFYVTIVWAVLYTIAYPAWPLVNQATAGILGWSTRADVAAEIAAAEEANAEINIRLASADLNAIVDDTELATYATSAGAAVFRTWCAQCHGSGAAGAKGYPNLLDDAWLWGGDIEAIHYTISHGIRNEDDPDAHYSEMPAFGADELLEPEQIDEVVNYVMSLSGTPQDASKVEAGAVVYEENCAACHMEDGSGDRMQGAPNLSDAIWLYGGDYDTLVETVTYSRFGVMPPWSAEASPAGRLTEAEIRAVATYVHQLGGGE
ncbi:cytochrome-c oxidase, cbb3-type subunit III [Sedimentitalea arenosa]|jgi:cytochrome c oxidase cbb3-type subunit 3|uniref:Cbb3-type cytochrome c oxidase subunit n=1 Tax=Sedimentitalea arenosa TaxID=2798803 RepID=A0A8J7LS15_9RHOB|nr:cytochrome-c oxidase, cbb3-type subunit III [Arenibacterium arenosum]MBJ6372358.1 cytochrome-c oxidase, cbb3-type subunit III [Arenibacterium arenosum]